MTWNHRVVHNSDGTYTINEVYYNDDGSVWAWTAPVEVIGESLDEVRQTLQQMQECLMAPVLESKDLPHGG